MIGTPSSKANLQTVSGVISAFSVVNLSMSKPGNLKKKKAAWAIKRKAPKNITPCHYMQRINDTMGIMDEFPEMQEFDIVMDNTPIHVLEMFDPIIIKREYTPVYLPPHSPERNPIEQFWSI
ncbi:hypothetical protein G6F37_005907 [Rhizopus arrhizus]|nr:hypothetical protein G6F38_011235 [Rhizopus arrhizus]KAG1158320.1 hypothetical protein G6F37_005907 [Rhizopus arrhizus]